MNFNELLEQGLGYVWLVILALWGGTVNYISRIRQGKMPFSFVELIGEWCISGFVGVATMYLCMEYSVSWYFTAFLVAITGHMGSRAIFMFENKVRTAFNASEKKDEQL